MNDEKMLKVSKIEQGTVIDHIPSGLSEEIKSHMGLDRNFIEHNTVISATNVESERMERKDVIKIENKKLDRQLINLIGVAAPQATINIIENGGVKKKLNPRPQQIKGILSCPNRNCITNAPKQRVESWLVVIQQNPLEYCCYYCEDKILGKDII